MKIKIELTSKEKVAALGKGVREINLSFANGGFQRQSAVQPPKNKILPRKEKYKNPFGV
jgi:hypothetical protein